MPSAPIVTRAITIVLVCVGGLAACGGLEPHVTASPGAPSITSVVKARYETPVDLDHGGLQVTPPPAGAKAAVSMVEASAMFEAADAVQGPHAFAILGLGDVTVAPRDERTPPPTTTTTPPPPSTVPPTTAPPPPPPPPPTTTTAPTTTTTSPPPTTTTTTTPTPPPTATTSFRPPSVVTATRRTWTAFLVDTTSSSVASTTTSSAGPPSTAPGAPQAVLPGYRRRLAWVGIAWGAAETCPGSTTTLAPSPSTTTYVAIVIDAVTGHRVLAYRSGGSSPCGGASRAPAVTEPNELVSVSWRPVGPASTAVQIQIPPCGRYYGWTQMPTTGTGIADQVVVAVPFDPSCGSVVAPSQAVDQVVPLGPGQSLVGHAAVGPIRALETLPTS